MLCPRLPPAGLSVGCRQQLRNRGTDLALNTVRSALCGSRFKVAIEMRSDVVRLTEMLGVGLSQNSCELWLGVCKTNLVSLTWKPQ